MPNCTFCGIDLVRIIDETNLSLVIRDGYPVSEGHTLVIVKRHVASVFDTSESERADCMRLLVVAQMRLKLADPRIDGWNVGVNVGTAGGQTINHCHWHLIPRRTGDCPNPKGGVRGVIAGDLADWTG